MLLSIILGVVGIPVMLAAGYTLWRMYCRLGFINTILFAGAIPFMMMGIQKAISNILFNLPNGHGDLKLTEIFTTPLLIGLGMLILALIWTLRKALDSANARTEQVCH